MNLSGENKKAFEAWYTNKTKYDYSLNYMEMVSGHNTYDPSKHLEFLECVPFPMQIGVLLEYYRSIGIAIVVFPTTTHYRMYVREFNGKNLINEVEDVPNSERKTIKYYDSFDLAHESAFDKLNDLINEK
jgi:hypothetical protein